MVGGVATTVTTTDADGGPAARRPGRPARAVGHRVDATRARIRCGRRSPVRVTRAPDPVAAAQQDRHADVAGRGPPPDLGTVQLAHDGGPACATGCGAWSSDDGTVVPYKLLQDRTVEAKPKVTPVRDQAASRRGRHPGGTRSTAPQSSTSPRSHESTAAHRPPPSPGRTSKGEPASTGRRWRSASPGVTLAWSTAATTGSTSSASAPGGPSAAAAGRATPRRPSRPTGPSCSTPSRAARPGRACGHFSDARPDRARGPDGLLGPAEVRALAAALDVRPTKTLGQNFVHDANTVRRIVNAAEPFPDDVVCEVGPGLGSLTLGLLGAAAAWWRSRSTSGWRSAARRRSPSGRRTTSTG